MEDPESLSPLLEDFEASEEELERESSAVLPCGVECGLMLALPSELAALLLLACAPALVKPAPRGGEGVYRADTCRPSCKHRPMK